MLTISTGTSGENLLRVLIVEDDEQLAASTRALLERERFTVAVSHDAEDGLHQARYMTKPYSPRELVARIRAMQPAYVVTMRGYGHRIGPG